MELHQVRYFCAIVRHGTFTRAAKSEHVTQPSLSHQIMKLEDELGGKLFVRLPRAARLTALGEFFLPHALTILHEIRECKAGARKIMASTEQARRDVSLMALTAAVDEPGPLSSSESGMRALGKGA
jgi:LysR family hydrogen peroxide-inducible transcriptional activator